MTKLFIKAYLKGKEKYHIIPDLEPDTSDHD